MKCYASTVRFPRYGRAAPTSTPSGCVLRGRAVRPTSPYCYGGHGERETPGSIPNPEAKPFSADGTARETVWESRTSPDNF